VLQYPSREERESTRESTRERQRARERERERERESERERVTRIGGGEQSARKARGRSNVGEILVVERASREHYHVVL